MFYNVVYRGGRGSTGQGGCLGVRWLRRAPMGGGAVCTVNTVGNSRGGAANTPAGRPFILDPLGRTMKPQLPECLCALLPDDVLGVINSFVPHLPKPKKNKRKGSMDSVDSTVSSVSRSPDVQRDLRLIQRRALKGTDGMFMRDLEDFVLF
jgi:hypothetical protein